VRGNILLVFYQGGVGGAYVVFRQKKGSENGVLFSISLKNEPPIAGGSSELSVAEGSLLLFPSGSSSSVIDYYSL